MSAPFRTQLSTAGSARSEVLDLLEGGLLEEHLTGTCRAGVEIHTPDFSPEKLTRWARHPDERVPARIIEGIDQSRRAFPDPIPEPWPRVLTALRERALEGADQEGKLWTPLLDQFWSSPACRSCWKGYGPYDLPPRVEERLTRLQAWIKQRPPKSMRHLGDLLDFRLARIFLMLARDTPSLQPKLIEALLEKAPGQIQKQRGQGGHLELGRALLGNPSLSTSGLEILQQASSGHPELQIKILGHPKASRELRHQLLTKLPKQLTATQKTQAGDADLLQALKGLFQSDPRVYQDPGCWKRAPAGLPAHLVRGVIHDQSVPTPARAAAVRYAAQQKEIRGFVCENILRFPEIVQQIGPESLLPLLEKADHRYRKDLIRLMGQTPSTPPPDRSTRQPDR